MTVLLGCLGVVIGLGLVAGVVWGCVAIERRRKEKSWMAPPSGRWDESTGVSSSYGDSHTGGGHHGGGDGHAGW